MPTPPVPQDVIDQTLAVLEQHGGNQTHAALALGISRGALFGRIQLIRKQSSAGGEHFARLEINQASAIKKLLLITSNPQLDDLFANLP